MRLAKYPCITLVANPVVAEKTFLGIGGYPHIPSRIRAAVLGNVALDHRFYFLFSAHVDPVGDIVISRSLSWLV